MAPLFISIQHPTEVMPPVHLIVPSFEWRNCHC